MFRIRKKFRFEAAHQLERAFTKECVESIHGHSYVVEIFLVAQCLDGDMMVVDFGRLKEWIDLVKLRYDHALILTEKLLRGNPCEGSRKVVIVDANPTAELFAGIFFEWLKEWVKGIRQTNGLGVDCVRVHETDTGWAEFVDR